MEKHFVDCAVLTDRLLDDVQGRPGQFFYPAIAAREGWLYIAFTHRRKSIAFCQLSIGLWHGQSAQPRTGTLSTG